MTTQLNKWRKKQKEHYLSLTAVADGFAVGFGFWTFMAILMEEGALDIGLLAMALATSLFIGQTLKDKAHSFFPSDTPEMFMPKVFDFIEALRYSKSEGNSSERRKDK
jgi:hypothetical protein